MIAVELVEHGKIQRGQIVLSAPVGLPDGTDVVVRIEAPTAGGPARPDSAAFSSLPVFGMWADRENMQDAVDWVNQEREQWRNRGKQE
ncbi:MAG: hypothetical protein AMXMBFR13_38470 [Phycisphaerae bacterium]